MADNQLSFADVQSSVNQLVNDNTAQNNAVAAQIQEVQRLLTDFAAKSQGGETVSQASYQAVIAQLASVHSLVQSNTASVQSSAAAIADADPLPATGTQASTGTSTGAQSTGSAQPSQTTLTGATTPGLSSTPNPTGAGASTLGENPSSGTGQLP